MKCYNKKWLTSFAYLFALNCNINEKNAQHGENAVEHKQIGTASKSYVSSGYCNMEFSHKVKDVS